jgi:hypothetical protein
MFTWFLQLLGDANLGRRVSTVLQYPSPSVHIFVCGDDSIIAVSLFGRVHWLSGDFSSFDQAQGAAVLDHEYRILDRLGVDAEVIALLRHLSTVPYVVQTPRGDKLVINRKRRAMRDTGGPDTTIGNSIVNGLVWYWAADVLLGWAFGNHITQHRHVPRDELSHQLAGVQSFVEVMGFKVKLKVAESIETLEFLKGTFYLTTTLDWVWAPLPSRFLKLGKCIRDPRLVYRTRDLPTAVERHARSLAASYHAYSQVPLLRAFVTRFYHAGDETAGLQIERMVTPTQVILADPTMQIADRYGVDPVDILQVEAWITHAPLFTFFEHPLFGALAGDYS